MQMNTTTEIGQLILNCQTGDAVAVQTLVRNFEAPVYRLAISILNDPAEADEATQDTLISVVDKLESFRGEANFKTWLFSIALNVCRMRLRKRRSRERLNQALHILFHSKPPEHPEDIVSQKESQLDVWRAIAALDDRHREIIILRYYHELKLEEIAKVIGVSERTIRTQLHNAHERMRSLMTEKVGGR